VLNIFLNPKLDVRAEDFGSPQLASSGNIRRDNVVLPSIVTDATRHMNTINDCDVR
jgi:hypothetical protein